MPLRVFEQRYMQMAKACLRDGTAFGVCAIREGAEVGAPATPYDVGTIAKIAQWDMAQLGVLEIVAHGTQRFRILERRTQPDGLQLADIELMAPEREGPVPASCSGCVQLLERIIEQHAGLFLPPHELDSAAWVGARLAELLPLPLAIKQELLELDDAVARLERLNALLRANAREGS
ncbi:MAG TPA: LON peptidase substrate-binding domain-containing protein [Burkholderiales bacterium]|nr:LON peptidase substrate-binding domain-containing protein [Burkholderiales bacterium]